MSEQAERGVSSGPEPIHPQPPTPQGGVRERKPLPNLLLRLVTAALLIPPIIWVIFQGGLWVLGVVVTIILIGLTEFYQLIEAKGAEPLRGFGMLAGAAVPVVTYFGGMDAATMLMSVTLLGLMVAQLQKARISESLASISGTFFGIFYVGWLLSHVISLREFYSAVQTRFGAAAVKDMDPNVGAFYLFFTIFVVIGGDAGAYFAGRVYGRRKLAPKISPSKTVEGALGALLASLVLGLACKAGFDAFRPAWSAGLSFTACAVLAPVLAGVGIMGDLVESLLKRDAKVKDTGRLLPGTGGVLDRVDSNLLAIPVMYYLLLAATYLAGGSSAVNAVAVLP